MDTINKEIFTGFFLDCFKYGLHIKERKVTACSLLIEELPVGL